MALRLWLGFPKGLDISKAIDKKLGAERKIVGLKPYTNDGSIRGNSYNKGGYERVQLPITAPATPEAKQWEGWGTALKPAVEPIILARKPLSEATVAENVLKWGTGAINIDGCRVGTEQMGGYVVKSRLGRRTSEGGEHKDFIATSATGRFPANVLLDEEAAAMLDEQAGERGGGFGRRGGGGRLYGKNASFRGDGHVVGYGDSGGASRFFYVAKASRRERTMGGKVENNHPTVKPIKLMRYLCRLATPPGGTVLDPFAGSGTTLLAAVQEGFPCIGIEKEPEYCEIIRRRMSFAGE